MTVASRWLCLALLVPGFAGAAEPLFANLDLSQGKAGWSEWAQAKPHAWTVDPDVGHGGKPSLRIDALDRADSLMVMTTSDRLKPGERYSFEVWWRTKDLKPGSQLDFRVIFRGAKGEWLAGTDYYAYESHPDGPWTGKRYRVTIPAKAAQTTIGIWVRQAQGTIWASDMSVAPISRAARGFDSMYVYDPEQVPLEGAPLANYAKLLDAKSPFLPRAGRWNRLMVDVAFWQEDLARARRELLYAGRDAAQLAAPAAALDRALGALDALQQTYGRLYDAQDAAGLATRFDPAAAALEQEVKTGHQAVVTLLDQLNPRPATGWTDVPAAPTDQPWWDAAAHRPRYTLWNRWSDPRFREAEAPLELGDCQTLTSGAPDGFQHGVATWGSYEREREKLTAAGARRFTLITHDSLHDKGYLAPEFVAQQQHDPDLRMWDRQGQPIGPESGVTQYNWLNPVVRAHLRDVLTQMAQHFRNQPEYQFYVSSWESAGPYAGGVRIGENPSHKVAFRAWLRGRYTTIDALNHAWNTGYTSFDAISPAREQAVPVGEAGTALAIETERWAQEAYVDYVSDVTAALRAVDPTKPVIGEQSGLLDIVLSPRVVDSVDILGYHNHARTTMPVQLYLNSLTKLTGRPTGLYENFWGCQEDHPARMAEEKVMRAELRRYLYRHAAWGRCTQTWWYAYTSAPYLLTYNGNWFNPVYDLTTFRYCAAGLPVEKRKADRFDALVRASRVADSQLLIVQPYTAMLTQRRSGETWQEWLAWHNLLFPRNLLYEVVPDEWLAAGRAPLAPYRAVILPVATHLDARLSRMLRDYLTAGGTVIASGAPGLYDELGRADGTLLAACEPPLTARREAGQGSWRFSFGAAPAADGTVTARVGQGRLILLPVPLDQLPDQGAGLADLVRTRVVPAAEAPGTTLELLLRQLPGGRCLLGALNRDPDQPTTGDVLVRGEYPRVADADLPRPMAVPARVEGGRTRFTVRLDPGETAWYLLARPAGGR